MPLSFSDLADEAVAHELATRATMMGQPCLKANGTIVACAGPGDALVVRLGADRVQEEIAAGHGAPFGPGATPFANWVEVTHASPTYARERFYEALEGVAP